MGRLREACELEIWFWEGQANCVDPSVAAPHGKSGQKKWYLVTPGLLTLLPIRPDLLLTHPGFVHMESVLAVHLMDGAAKAMTTHIVAHLLDGAVEAATMSQWR